MFFSLKWQLIVMDFVVTCKCEKRTVMQRYNIGLLFSFRHLKWQLIINGL